ncbi:MAG: hypothetical protein K6G91_05915 [Kiritimatiellae bacterium]|nr:hypothetical protein [Kiritimatiellia bacterium]
MKTRLVTALFLVPSLAHVLLAEPLGQTAPDSVEAETAAIPYQAVLTDENGVALQSPASVRFSLYAQASGGEALWAREMDVPLDASGLFSVELKDEDGAQGATLDAAIRSGRDAALYIGLEVKRGEQWTAVPTRQKILPVPYASYASDVTGARGDFTVTGRATLKNVEASIVSVSGRFSVQGEAVVEGDVSVAGNVDVQNTGCVSGYGTLPVGSIILWYGDRDSLPSGWAVCDGRGGTPDLIGRFVMGAGSNSDIGRSGGRTSYTLTLENIPPHDHLYFGDDQLEGRDSQYGTTKKYADMSGYDADSKQSGSSKVYKTSETGKASGSQSGVSTLPPYMKLLYIKRMY